MDERWTREQKNGHHYHSTTQQTQNNNKTSTIYRTNEPRRTIPYSTPTSNQAPLPNNIVSHIIIQSHYSTPERLITAPHKQITIPRLYTTNASQTKNKPRSTLNPNTLTRLLYHWLLQIQARITYFPYLYLTRITSSTARMATRQLLRPPVRRKRRRITYFPMTIPKQQEENSMRFQIRNVS